MSEELTFTFSVMISLCVLSVFGVSLASGSTVELNPSLTLLIAATRSRRRDAVEDAVSLTRAALRDARLPETAKASALSFLDFKLAQTEYTEIQLEFMESIVRHGNLKSARQIALEISRANGNISKRVSQMAKTAVFEETRAKLSKAFLNFQSFKSLEFRACGDAAYGKGLESSPNLVNAIRLSSCHRAYMLKLGELCMDEALLSEEPDIRGILDVYDVMEKMALSQLGINSKLPRGNYYTTALSADSSLDSTLKVRQIGFIHHRVCLKLLTQLLLSLTERCASLGSSLQQRLLRAISSRLKMYSGTFKDIDEAKSRCSQFRVVDLRDSVKILSASKPVIRELVEMI